MSQFTEDVFVRVPAGSKGLVTGAPQAPVRHSWAQIHATGRRMAGALAEFGVGAGSPVAILAGRPDDVAPLIQAVWMRRGSVTMLHQPTPRADLTVWLEDARAVLTVLGAELVVVGAPFEAAVEGLRAGGVGVVEVAALRSGTAVEPLPADEDDVALLQLTSGSTGTPKAVVITHGNLDRNWRSITATAEFADDDVMISWLPFSHDFGMIGLLMGPMQTGLDAVIVTPADFLADPLIWAELITRYRGTITAAPNFAYALWARSLNEAPDGAYDLSSLRIAVNGAEPIDMATIAAIQQAGARFGLAESALTAAYGMAETTLGISLSALGEVLTVDSVDADELEEQGYARAVRGEGARQFAVLGRPLTGLGLRVVDGRGDRLPPRMVGEFQVRGAAVTRTYLTEHGAHAAVDAGGWLSTGDLGYLTDTGEIVVCGRVKDVIIVGGRNIFPTDIERAAGRVAGVRRGNAVAVSIRQADHREQFAVVVESREHADTEAAERIRNDVARTVYDEIGVGPKFVAVTEPGSLPKTPSGKLRRSATLALLARADA
ncbi:fatty acyl-AMP ligase [Nocardia sp. NPDC005366]|uniref:fatty acyl-AMP ligase n=1 Tax=Nocardia sp. NPDC005366 TaxID=3156878 RepID=UPI0033BBBB02